VHPTAVVEREQEVLASGAHGVEHVPVDCSREAYRRAWRGRACGESVTDEGRQALGREVQRVALGQS
jgi:hypothetical protein